MLVECICLGGVGFGGVLMVIGFGMLVVDGKQIIQIDGCSFIVEKLIQGDFVLIVVWQVDYVGNLEYMLMVYNFNLIMVMVVDIVIVELEYIVLVGVILFDSVKMFGVLVDYILEWVV